MFNEKMPKKPVGVHNVNVSKPTSLEGAMNDRVKLKKLEIGAHVSESCFASLQQAHYEHFQALVCFFYIFLCKNLSAAEGCPQWPQVLHLAVLRLLARMPLLHIPL